MLTPADYRCPWDDQERACQIYHAHGFVVLHDLYDEQTLVTMHAELAAAQTKLINGELDEFYGSSLLDEPGAEIDGEPYRHYLINCTDLSPATQAACQHPLFIELAKRLFNRPTPWLNDYCRFGVVYQDARADNGSQYSRIGWHSDFQAGEDIDAWPGFAFTIHIDGTSPANGFLRVVPGSHLQDADKDELGALGFRHIPGEVPVFAERGDVILHDYKLWHSAARGTADGEWGQRRHIRGGFYAGERLPLDHGIGAFYKNAAR